MGALDLRVNVPIYSIGSSARVQRGAMIGEGVVIGDNAVIGRSTSFAQE